MGRYLITSALPYINGIKHLGNLAGSMLPADVYSRFLRTQGHEVLYICATDEHGTPAELAAQEAGLEVADYCARQHRIQREIYRQFDLSFDYFGRSSSDENHRLTQYFADRLTDNGLIYEETLRQLYSIDDGRFLPDRYVVGTCPHCGYEAARGDQCESCTRVLDPTDLIEPRSAVSGSASIEIRESCHLFLKQSELAPRLREWIESRRGWPRIVTSIALKWLNEGLRDRCITRDLNWGVPVNRPGFEGKVYYVWFDAPIEYIGATREWSSQGGGDWKSWWFEADDVTYAQFMAKDNVPFHTIGFPTTLMGSGEPWKVVDYIKGFSWLNYYGGKFSTSAGRGVFLDQALELLPADYWRWFLTANAPENDDVDFTWELFAANVNKDLADVLGNFVNRTLRFASKRFGPQIPEGGSFSEAETRLAASLGTQVESYTRWMNEMDFRKSCRELRRIWTSCNGYLAEAAPWAVIKEDPERAAAILRTSINLIRLVAVLSAPILPATAHTLLSNLGVESDETGWPDPEPLEVELQRLEAGRSYTIPELLFRKIQDTDIEAWKDRFGS